MKQEGFLKVGMQPNDMGEKKPKPDAGTEPAEIPFEVQFDFTKKMREWIAAKMPKDLRLKAVILAVLTILTCFLFVTLLGTDFSAMLKLLGAVVLMMLSGEIARGVMGWDGFWGLIMLKDRTMLDWIDRQAHRFAPLWSLIADMGMVMGYGFLSIRLLGPAARKPRELILLFAASIPLLLIFSLVVMPSAYDILRYAIGNADLNAASAHIRATSPLQGNLQTQIGGQDLTIPLMTIAMGIITLVGGLALAATASLVLYAISLLGPIMDKIVSIVLNLLGQNVPATVLPPPGGTPLLPGINLPFVEGILAMAVLLVVHELMHAFLARIHNIRLDSAGIVFFGILPFGAFVDPDEKELSKAEIWKTNQVIAAGSASNMITAVVAFMLFVGMSVLNNVYPMDGIGVGFIARTLALVVALNVLVGVVNLLPLPLFDGHRLMKAGVKHEQLDAAITIAVVLAFVVNFLPWIFR